MDSARLYSVFWLKIQRQQGRSPSMLLFQASKPYKAQPLSNSTSMKLLAGRNTRKKEMQNACKVILCDWDLYKRNARGSMG